MCVELDKCEEIVDLEFCIIDCLTAIDYTDGECVPCEIGKNNKNNKITHLKLGSVSVERDIENDN